MGLLSFFRLLAVNYYLSIFLHRSGRAQRIVVAEKGYLQPLVVGRGGGDDAAGG